MSLAQRRGVSREGMSGALIPFSLKFGIFIYLNQENSICESCFLDVAGLSDSQPSIDRGIGLYFERSVSWKAGTFLMSNQWHLDFCYSFTLDGKF